MTHTPGPLAVSRGNTGDHAYYVAAGRLDLKSGMTFFDRHVAWVSRKEDADLFAAAPRMREALAKYVKWAEDDRLRQKYGNPVQIRDFILDDARALLREIAGKE